MSFEIVNFNFLAGPTPSSLHPSGAVNCLGPVPCDQCPQRCIAIGANSYICGILTCCCYYN